MDGTGWSQMGLDGSLADGLGGGWGMGFGTVGWELRVGVRGVGGSGWSGSRGRFCGVVERR